MNIFSLRNGKDSAQGNYRGRRWHSNHKTPETATADAQISVIQSLISQQVDGICIAGNDENALQAALEDAMNEGIKVSCLDAKVTEASDGGTEVILGSPFKFDPSNIDEWKDVY